MTSLSELNDDIVRSMSVGAVISDFGGKINSLDFHRTADLLVTSSDDDSVRLFDITTAKLLKTTYHKKHGADRICFTHHPSSLICSSKYLDSNEESLRYLSLFDNRCLRYFKGHKERVVSLCMSPVNDGFMSGSLDHSVRMWDLRVNACQGILHLRGRPTVAYDQQGLVFAVAMEGGAIKLFDSRSYDKGPFDTFLVGGDTAEVCDIKFSNDGKSMLLTTTNNHVYILDAYHGEKKCGFSMDSSLNATIEATFTPDGRYVLSGSGDGTIHAWNISGEPNKMAKSSSGNKSGIRIMVAGDRATGKSSLIATAVSETFPTNVAPVLSPSRLADDMFPDRVPITIIGTSSRIERRNKVGEEMWHADAVLVTHACDRLEILDCLSTYWLPEFRQLEVATLESYIGVPSCLRWAPRRVMFAAAASSVLTFWIPNDGDSVPES